MPSALQFLGQLRSVFARQSKLRRGLTFLLFLAIAGALTYASFRRGGGPYAALYPNLNLEDAAAVAAHLKTSGVEYRLDNDGTTISVPKDKIPQLRMDLAQANLPTGGGVGFEWFDKPPIGMTDRVQQINYVRALQGELSRSIATLQAVERARVILAIPDRTTFLRTEENKPSASVVLELARGASLTPRNVEGILNLVSRAVEGLEPERVALVDTRSGETLNRSYQKPEELMAEQNLAFQTRYQRDLEQDIETMLERWVGKGRVVARVNAGFSFAQTTTNKITYDPDAKAVETETEQADNVEGLTVAAVGTVGTASQIPGRAPAASASGPAASRSNGSILREKRYKVSETNTTVVEPMGNLQGLTVAVMVDYKDEEKTDANTGKTQIVSAPRKSEEIASFEKLVQQTVGYTEDKADTMKISVECVPFVRSEQSVEDLSAKGLERQEMVRFMVTWGVYGLLAILAALFVLRPVLHALLDTMAPVARLRPALAEGPAGAAGELSGLMEGEKLALTHVDQARRMLERAESSALNKRIEDLLKSDPQRAATLIRKWLEENK